MPQQVQCLPTFLVIGAEKAGTTWLKHNLRTHPDVFVPSEKELHFFDKEENWRRGVSWYASFFLPGAGLAARGELTPGYLSSPVAPERIRQLLPDVKLLAILRQPVDRAYSNYQMLRRSGRTSASFEEELLRNPGLIDRGSYGRHLKRWFSFFPTRQIKIFFYEDLRARPQWLLEQVWYFLQVKPDHQSPLAEAVIFGGGAPRWPAVNYGVRLAAKILRAAGFGALVDRKRRAVQDWLRRRNSRTGYPPLPQQVRARLTRSYFQDDISLLETLLQRDLGHWLR